MYRTAVYGHISCYGRVGDSGGGVGAVNSSAIVGRIVTDNAVGDGGGRIVAAEDPTAAVSCYYAVCDSRRRGAVAYNCFVVDLAILNSKSR
jgi:hypothetical protein